MVKIIFNSPEKYKVGERKRLVNGELIKIDLTDTDDVIFGKSINHNKGIILIHTIYGYNHYIDTKQGNRIKSILPFNENQTKQFKIV